MEYLKAYPLGVTGEEDEVNEDVVAGVNGKEAVAGTYLVAVEAKAAFAEGDPGGVVAFEEGFVDMPAAGWLQEGMGEDQAEEEVLP